MKKHLNTFDIIQNVTISAIAMHRFTYSFQATAQKFDLEIYPKTHYFFPVLPLIYHKDSLQQILSSNELYTLLAKHPEFCSSLQHRMNKMSSQTFDALNMAFNKGLLTYNKETHQISSLRNPFTRTYHQDITHIVLGANKLGKWFAKTPIEEIQIMLKIEI
ncbi:three component ABC system middle component [Flavobacterium sp. C3NV]|uniref:three component ABC system middle component n=1 Tax=Flavobacterium sp. C3NV TaxID=3393358 RepID=UPI00398FFD9E